MSKQKANSTSWASTSDEHMRRAMERQGVSAPDCDRVLAMRSRIRAQVDGHGAPRLSADINASLQELGTNLRAYREGTDESIAGVRADVQSLQQTVARIENDGVHIAGGALGPSVSASAMKVIEEDAQFIQAAEQATRNMRVGRFEARANLDTSIRAALTNEGKGNTGDTSVPSNPERRGFVDLVTRPLRLIEALPSRPTSSDAVEFVQLTATGDATEQIHEGDAKAEIDMAGDLVRAEIVTVAAWTAASKQVLSDQGALSNQIDLVIRNKVLSRLENQLINGVGGQGKINGLINQATPITPAIATTPADMIGEALQVLTDNGYRPNLVIMNSLDWFRLQITRKNDTDDEYVFGSPTSPLPASLWNTRIVTPSSMPGGQVLVLDTSFVNVLDREQMNVAVTNTHADFFVRNLVAILGELRAGLEVLDTGAVLKLALQDPTP